ncbi:hypothetical protein AZF37_05625 [endosymbiont 'TC1' of Trimyema compressum]|uniref:shikimate dehydrogenase n=1 Tax=endosymbiont 'TC1' of Trimyema compressum TaxID=243899 RepID=UPI0007F056C3|nr:shikimate dehydrogenase [endosymbiont 'TC1' of Trimyema compressum]AMP20722.1 hypothetical protein AZF37_05625 [endosymbiont 'TC1' of Trimyema compressum]
MRNRLGVIGYPLGHSLSPEIQNGAIKELGLNLTYEKWPLKEADLKEFVTSVKKEYSSILGFNVTIPYKETILKYLDEISERAQVIGAVNTVHLRAGKLVGENTDGMGFIESLKRQGMKIENKSVLIIGTGGAAKGISISLAFSGLKTIDFVGRNKKAASLLVNAVKRLSGKSNWYSFSELATMSLSKYDFIAQTTPLGMKGIKGKLEFPYNHLRENQVLVDIIYNPLKTDFLLEGEKRGTPIVNGVGMLVCQGAEALALWTGKKPNKDLMEKILIANLVEAKNE